MRRLLPTIAAILVAALVVAAVGPLRDAVGHALHGDVDGLRAELRGLGAAGAAVLVGLILVHAVVIFPAETFTRLPYAPTLEGQYILKNVVLIGAGLVIGATARGGHLVCDACCESAH